ncbi:MAG: ABC transporter substrate-binding protein [Acidimicrobiia bacterium]
MKATWHFGLRLFALLAVFALVVVACTGGDTTDTTDTTEGGDDGGTATADAAGSGDDGDDSGPPSVEGGTFRVGFISNITTDNWFASVDTESSTNNQAYLGNAKTSMFKLTNPGFVYVPGIASTLEPVKAVQEGDVWVVEQPIRTDMTWSDGVPVTANDLAFYFDITREFKLGGDHASNFVPTVLSVTAPSDDVVRIEFDGEPGLATWQNGVGFADFVPSHFWTPFVEEARAAAAELAATVTDEEAVEEIVAASLEDEDAETDIAEEDVAQEDIDAWIADSVANEALMVLYAVAAPMEPSVGPQIFAEWEPGAFAATVSNPTYFDTGTENTLYSDGSFRITNSGRGEDAVFGGEGSGDTVAQFIEGPFVSEILWVEHATKEAAYENLAAGQIDFVFDPDGITSSLQNQLAANPDLRFSVSQDEGFRYMAFNMRKAPMSDLAFRQAVATVINKELVADAVLAGAVFPAYTMIHPGLITFYNADVPRAGWVDGGPMSEADRFLTAVQILKDSGYTWDAEPIIDPENPDPVTTPGVGLTMPNGTKVPELQIMAPGLAYGPFRATFAIWIEQWLNDLGVPAATDPTDFEAIISAVFPPQTEETTTAWDMYLLGWRGADVWLPGALLVQFFHSNHDAVRGGGFNTPGYRSDRFDAVADAFEAATDIETAAELTKEMDLILAEDLPYIVLFRTSIIEAYHRSVQFPAEVILGGHSAFPDVWPGAVLVSE